MWEAQQCASALVGKTIYQARTCVRGGKERSMSIKVLIVDDSAVIREVLHPHPRARRRHRRRGHCGRSDRRAQQDQGAQPDVVTLDIEMPNMNGLAFLDKLMRLHPMPVVMVSTLTTKGASETLLALELGAVDFVAKPSA